jgi:hypothetical protein
VINALEKTVPRRKDLFWLTVSKVSVYDWLAPCWGPVVRSIAERLQWSRAAHFTGSRKLREEGPKDKI